MIAEPEWHQGCTECWRTIWHSSDPSPGLGEHEAEDPEGAAERAGRQEAGRARIAGRMRRYRGE